MARLSILVVFLFAGLTSPASAAEPAVPVQPLEIRRVFGDGRHNAFTALAKWQGAYWLAFRNAASHNAADGDLILLRSVNGKDWKEARRFDILPDDRDPQFLVTERRLFLYDPALKGRDLTTFVTYTDDGTNWSQPAPVYQPRYIFWKPVAHNGRYYATAHKKDDTAGGMGRDVHLIVSDDGLQWTKVSTIRAGKWESETTLHFRGDSALAFLRQKYGGRQANVYQSEPPYQVWTARPSPADHFSGHCVHTIQGTTYLLTRGLDPTTKKHGHVICTLEADGSLKPYTVLPAAGDFGYAEVAVQDGNMLVSFYSGHETEKPNDQTNIYLAVIPLRK